MRRPNTAVTNSAVDSSWTQRTSQAAGTTVRYGSTAKPTTNQATSQTAIRAPGVGALAEDAGAARDEREADEQPQGGAEETDDADHGR